MTAEYNAANGSIMRRYVPGPGADEPVVWYEGAGLSDKRWLHADERGSVVAVTDTAGTAIGINRYDDYGIPASTNIGRFQYTGQAWLPELGMYYYKARIYSPSLGRFMQTDPIGYGDGMNLNNYVGSDPVNFTDPTGTCLHWTSSVGADGIQTFVLRSLYPGPCDTNSPDIPQRFLPMTPLPAGGDRGGGGGVNATPAPPPSEREEQSPCQNKSLLVNMAETALDALGLAGDAAQVLGAYTGFAPLAGVGTAVEYASVGGSAALHWSTGDNYGLAKDAAGLAAGWVPGGRLARKFGGAAFDWGRRSNGQLVTGWNRKREAQDAAYVSAQKLPITAASLCPNKSG